MGSKKTNRKKAVGRRKNLVDVPQIKSFAIITLGYAIIVALLALLVGTTFATIIATPIWAFLYLVFSKWHRGSGKPEVADWRDLLRFPQLNYWNIFAVILTILAVQVVFGLLFAFVEERVRPEFYYSSPDTISAAFEELANDPRSLVVLLLSGVISCFTGGFIAGKLPNKKCPAPYRHGITATIICNLLNFSMLLPLFALSGEEDLPSSEDIGYIILGTSPSYLLSAFGTWCAIRKRRKAASAESSMTVSDGRADILTAVNNRGTGRQSRKKHGGNQLVAECTSIEEESTTTPDLPSRTKLATTIAWVRRRRLALSISIVVMSLLGLGVWAFLRKYPKPVLCENPPTTATLNFWPVAFVPGVACHEYPPVDARLVGTDHFSLSREEWERGLVAKKGDEIYVSIRINNGAISNAEQLNPGRGIARNVRLKTAIAQESSEIHYVEVEFAGDNTNTVVSRFKIATRELARIEVLPNSGELFNPVTLNLTSKDFDVGNNTLVIGDLPPKYDGSGGVIIRFRVRVVG
jgi:hypothetical protein